MRASKPKGELYEQLISRLDKAIGDGFHLEASWIAYAIVEDRIDSALDKSGGLKKPIRMLGPKLDTLQERAKTSTELRASMLPSQIPSLKAWKKRRNDLMHAAANGTKSFAQLETEANLLAIEGRPLVGALCSAVMRLAKAKKRMYRKSVVSKGNAQTASKLPAF